MRFDQLEIIGTTATRLHDAIKAKNYPGATLNVCRLMPPVSILWATQPPDSPHDRAAWDRRSAPVIQTLRLCLGALELWRECRGRRRVRVETRWMWFAVLDACDVLKLPGLDDLYSGVPALLPDDSGSTPAAVTGR